MKFRSRFCVTAILTLSFFIHTVIPANACGPETLDPIFVFTNSPDIPFAEFVKGKIGILQSSLGRKTLVIAHRYLDGGSFTEDEQRGLIEALRGKAPEDDDDVAIKAWIAARKEIVGEEQDPPAIYDERRHSGYDFFPNCTKNAFEVATQTLKDRVANYGAQDLNVRNWLVGQDVVFKNCAEGATAPAAPGPGSPHWLQKDRDYQIAAACFYSLNFNEARTRFQKISDDFDSAWQDTAAYLVGRTLVRQASLTDNETQKRSLYEQAETSLINNLARGGKLQDATKRLLGLVRFRLRPEERLRELAQVLNTQSGNENIRQDLIDYTWLLDKFDLKLQQEEEARKQKLNPTPSPTPYQVKGEENEWQRNYASVRRGDLIEINFSTKQNDESAPPPKTITLYRKPDVTEAEILRDVEIELARKLDEAETASLKESYTSALSYRQWLLSPNRQVNSSKDYDGCDSNCNELKLNQLPDFIRTDDLSDWIMTFQSKDPRAFTHAATRWRQSHSTAWLAVAVTKATKNSRGVIGLIREAERIAHDAPVFPTIAYHLVRLRLEMNRASDAQNLLDKTIAAQFDQLPISSQNLFLEQRAKLAGTVDEFLKFAARKPVAFAEFGSIGRITDLLRIQKSFWNPAYYTETKEEYEQKTDEWFKDQLLWEDRKFFDPESVDILNWHFSLSSLLKASRSAELPEYLRKSLALSVWTRAVLLKNYPVAIDVSTDIAKLAPEMSELLANFVNAKSREQRDDEALFILLRFPSLSPYVPTGIPELVSAEKVDYYFDVYWWCKPDDIEYQTDGAETPKVVENPVFLNPRELAAARKERADLSAIGNAKTFLGKRVLEWANRSRNDPRLPEALYIGVQANQSYKYGCGSWEEDEETRTKLEKLLREKFPQSPWTAKLQPAN